MLSPLLHASLDNALRLGDAGLSGPVARGDADTVARHVEALGAASPQALAAYLALARLTAGRALAAGLLAPQDAGRLLDVLAGRAAPHDPGAPGHPGVPGDLGVPDDPGVPGDPGGPGDSGGPGDRGEPSA